jgi:hypothetical protein
MTIWRMPVAHCVHATENSTTEIVWISDIFCSHMSEVQIYNILKPVRYILTSLPRPHISSYEQKIMGYKQFVGTFTIYFDTKCYIPTHSGILVNATKWKANINIIMLPYTFILHNKNFKRLHIFLKICLKLRILWPYNIPRYRSQWLWGLRRLSAAVRLLGLWLRIETVAWMFVSCECCVLTGRGLLHWADHLSRGVLPSVVCLSEIVKPG